MTVSAFAYKKISTPKNKDKKLSGINQRKNHKETVLIHIATALITTKHE